MNAREAKDFLVQQTVEQAALEHVPFSSLERRMMYFAESDDCPEDPVALNDAFEAQYDSDAYEAKISQLMSDAYRRLKEENHQSARTWDEAVRELRQGDHYLLVLLGDSPSTLSLRQFLPSWGFWKALTFGLFALAVCLVALAALLHHADSMAGTHSTPGYSSLPRWLQSVLLGLMVTSYLSFLLFPRQVGSAFSWLVRNTIGRIVDDSDKTK